MRNSLIFCATAMFLVVVALASGQTRSDDVVSPDALYKEALAADDRGDLQRAIFLYEKLLESHPNLVPVRINLGVVLVRTGRYTEATSQYEEALKLDPKNPVVLLNLSLAWYKQAEFGKAATELERLRKEHADNRQSLYLLADCYLRLGKDRDVIALLQPVYETTPDDRAVDYALGMALIRDGQVEKGSVVIDRIMKSGNNAEVGLLMGAAQLAAGDEKKAAATLRSALDANGKLPGAWSLYGRALLKTDDIVGAKDAFLRALQADPNDFDANLYLGAVLRHDGNYTEAAPRIEQALRLRPTSLEARFQAGALHLAVDHLEESRKELEQVEREWPEFQQVHVELATLYSRLGRKGDSEREREIVLKLNQKAREQGPTPDR